MMQNHTGYILTAASVKWLDDALFALNDDSGDESRVVVVQGYASNSDKLVTFEARVNYAGIARRA